MKKLASVLIAATVAFSAVAASAGELRITNKGWYEVSVNLHNGDFQENAGVVTLGNSRIYNSDDYTHISTSVDGHVSWLTFKIPTDNVQDVKEFHGTIFSPYLDEWTDKL